MMHLTTVHQRSDSSGIHPSIHLSIYPPLPPSRHPLPFLPRGPLTRARAPAAALGALVAAQAVTAGEDGDAREAAGLGDGRPQRTVGAVRVSAAPGPRLQALHVAVRAALTATGRPAGALAVPPGWLRPGEVGVATGCGRTTGAGRNKKVGRWEEAEGKKNTKKSVTDRG